MTPFWPAMMKRSTAARYCDLSEAAFVREVVAGRLPSGTLLGGKEHWFRPALDKALQAIAGDYTPTYEEEFWGSGQAA